MIFALVFAVAAVWILSRRRRLARQRQAVAGLSEAITPTLGQPQRLPSPRFKGSRGAM